MLTILACACGDRVSAAYVIPVNFTSSRNEPAPVMRRGSSRRLIGLPTSFSGLSTAATIPILQDRGGPLIRNGNVAVARSYAVADAQSAAALVDLPAAYWIDLTMFW